MLAEQQSLRFPHRLPFEMEQLQAGAVSNLSLEEKALWAARSQMLLRAAAAVAATSPYAQLVNPALVYPGASAAGTSHQQQQQHHQQQQQQQLGHLWWASSIGSTIFAAAHQQQLVASSSQQNPTGPAAPRPLYPSPLALAHHRFSPYHTATVPKSSTPAAPSPSPSRRATPSPTDSLSREAQDLSPS